MAQSGQVFIPVQGSDRAELCPNLGPFGLLIPVRQHNLCLKSLSDRCLSWVLCPNIVIDAFLVSLAVPLLTEADFPSCAVGPVHLANATLLIPCSLGSQLVPFSPLLR